MADDRYQFQSRYVKALRWLRWKPLYFSIACWRVVRWLACGAQPLRWGKADDGYEIDSRRESLALIWSLTFNESDTRMKHYFHWHEVRSRLGLKEEPRDG